MSAQEMDTLMNQAGFWADVLIEFENGIDEQDPAVMEVVKKKAATNFYVSDPVCGAFLS